MREDQIKDANKTFKYKLIGGSYSGAQYFSHLNAISQRLSISPATIKKAIKENNGKFKDYQVFVNERFVFNDFEKGDHIEVDGIDLEIVSGDYERVVVVKNKEHGTGVINLKKMELVSGLIYETNKRSRQRQNKNIYAGG